MAKPVRHRCANGLLVASMTAPLAIGAVGADSAAYSPDLLPPGQTLATVTENLYFSIGLKAISDGLDTLTLALDAAPADTLSARIDQVHLGLMAGGWSLQSQGTVENGGTTTRVLLAYRRAASPHGPVL
jgi:hypothetical protein